MEVDGKQCSVAGAHYSANASRNGVVLVNRRTIMRKRPSVTLPFPTIRVATAMYRTGNPLAVSYSCCGNVTTRVPRVLRDVQATVRSTLTRLRISSRGLTVSLTDAVPTRENVNSDTTMSITLAHTLFTCFSGPLGRTALLQLIGVSRGITRKGPDNLSTTATDNSTPLFCVGNRPFRTFPLGLGTCLVINSANIANRAGRTMSDVTTGLGKGGPRPCQSTVSQLNAFTLATGSTVRTGSPSRLKRLVGRTRTILSFLSMSDPSLSELISTTEFTKTLNTGLANNNHNNYVVTLTEAHSRTRGVRRTVHRTNTVQA